MLIHHRRGLTLIAMLFAVAMTFIDQTIVSVAAPSIQSHLGLSDGGLQWAINAYLLALSALFALGGRLADSVGPRRMVTLGVAIFAGASALCGLTPAGPIAESWLIGFRALQGVGAALMYPAALAIVVGAYRPQERGRALALFFGVAGGLTAVGPAAGGYLAAWTWRSIFWINVPVAAAALLLIAVARPTGSGRPARIDRRGLVLITAGVALSVFGLQQGGRWGWTNPLVDLAILLGATLLAGFVAVDRRVANPLIDLTILRDRTVRVQTVVLLAASVVFVPLFFFASEYGQVALGLTPARASLALLYFFLGYAGASQLGGRMLDRGGARRPVVLGSLLAALGLHLWAGHVTTLAAGASVGFIVLTGAGLGLLLGPANTDALNHAPSTAYGQAIGITQTARNLGAALGLAGLGSHLTGRFQSALTTSLVAQGDPYAPRDAASIAQLHAGSGLIPTFVRIDFATATSSVLTAMSLVMLGCAVLAWFALPRHRRAVTTSTAPAEPIAVSV